MLGRMAVSGGTRRELEPGDKLGGYTLEEALGEGGMGLVFKAHHTLIGGMSFGSRSIDLSGSDSLLFQYPKVSNSFKGAL